jgi:hypothetical protein
MAVVVYSVVRRHMKRTSGFTVHDGDTPPPASFALGPEETIIGWYRNPPPWEGNLIVFTSKALYFVEDDRVERVGLNELVGYEDPESKTDITGVRILTKSGFRFVRIAGCFGPNGNRKDAYSFIMVVRALVDGDPVVRHQHRASK